MMRKRKRQMLNHENIVKILVTRLAKKTNLDQIVTHETYDTGRYCGEIDVLARAGNRWRFYEVKTTDNDNAYSRALDQYWRYCKAFPERDVVGLYVTATCVQRMPQHHQRKHRNGR